MMIKKTLILVGFLTLFSGSASLAEAQVETVEIGIDGLACPFCAYGLEKKLKKVQGVGDVKIYVEKGLANLKHRKDQSIMYQEVESAVKDAGFTPGEIRMTVVGKISQDYGTLVLAKSDMKLLLKDNDKLRTLRSELKSAWERVRLIGRLSNENPKGGQRHPYTLAVEDFESLK